MSSSALATIVAYGMSFVFAVAFWAGIILLIRWWLT